MKISRLHTNIVEFFKSICVEFYFGFAIILIVITVLVGGIYMSGAHAREVKAKHPIGSHVVIKGIGVEGTVSGYSDCGCDVYIMTVDKAGQISKITVDSKMLN